MEATGFPPCEIEQSRDELFYKILGFTRDDLNVPVPPTEMATLRAYTYDDVVELAEQFGFDATSSERAGGIALPRAILERDDKDEDTSIPFWLRELDADDEEDEPQYVIKDYFAWIVMLRAMELGLHPTSEEDRNRVRLNREAKQFVRKNESRRQRPSNSDPERGRVFGMEKAIKPGTVIVRATRSGETKPVQVEVRKTRSFGNGSPSETRSKIRRNGPR
ncbi:hypothetical protein FV228_00255 [Methylobacterium sp. WL18]|uniref:hypothetical protein n=1 Tax=Methylobacterium sp. WL18 TaxID=2603897 RepID=UPI0011C9B830|nr:hypothetical protein [Methylobacterium sp. WL18]TXN76620.1 hypothetical protein FV228_00255 [Methylobacterium sp. WL18]